MPDFLTTEQELELRQKHRKEKDKKLADRIKAILSLNAGEDYARVARILLLDEITLRRYVKQYQEKGVVGLLECGYKGGKSRLTKKQEDELKQYLAANTQRTVSAVVEHVSKTYGVIYSVIGMTKLSSQIRF